MPQLRLGAVIDSETGAIAVALVLPEDLPIEATAAPLARLLEDLAVRSPALLAIHDETIARVLRQRAVSGARLN